MFKKFLFLGLCVFLLGCSGKDKDDVLEASPIPPVGGHVDLSEVYYGKCYQHKTDDVIAKVTDKQMDIVTVMVSYNYVSDIKDEYRNVTFSKNTRPLADFLILYTSEVDCSHYATALDRMALGLIDKRLEKLEKRK